jgi:hypothetical protein
MTDTSYEQQKQDLDGSNIFEYDICISYSTLEERATLPQTLHHPLDYCCIQSSTSNREVLVV